MSDIKKIIQIADIHIRNDIIRYDEYNKVINNLIEIIKEKTIDNTGNIIVVICGDIFHHKSIITPTSVELFNKLIQEITKISEIIIIEGNHDFNQNEIEERSVIKELLESNENKEKVYFLNKTGNYQIRNIGFGVVTLRDTLRKGFTSGQVDEIPEFPQPIPNIKNIALYHGTVNGCLLQNYLRSPKGIPIEWIKGYDRILLGDIHVRQITDNYIYSGSLVQQNFGEDIIDHGIIIYDIENNQTEEIDIYNEYGMMNIIYEGEWMIKYQNKYEKLGEKIKNKLFPTKLTIRINGIKTRENMTELSEILKEKEYQISNIIREDIDNNKIIEQEDIIHDIQYDTVETLINYLNKRIEGEEVNKWIRNPESLIITINEREDKKINNYNERIKKEIEKMKEEDKQIRKKR